MCDKELLIGYLYGELAARDREAFDRHLAACGECRSEVDALRGTRTYLESWAPPEPDLGFEIVRNGKSTGQPARWWRPSPAWGLAAAAMLVCAVAAGVANLQVKVGSEGLVVSTGWSRTAAPAAPVTTATLVPPADYQRLESRLKDLEGQLAARAQAAPVPARVESKPADSDAILRLVRQLVTDSEQRQEGVLARQILQVSRDAQAARQADYDRLVYVIQKLQGTSAETSVRQRALEDHVARVAFQR